MPVPSENRPPLTLQQIILMIFGFFGIQYGFGMQRTATDPIFSFLNADAHSLPLPNLAGPFTGLIVQLIIVALSDRTWSLAGAAGSPTSWSGSPLQRCRLTHPL